MKGLIFRSVALFLLLMPALLLFAGLPELQDDIVRIKKDIPVTALFIKVKDKEDFNLAKALGNVGWTAFAFSGQETDSGKVKLKLPPSAVIKAFHTQDKIYISIRWAAPLKSLNQTPWKWDYGLQIYRPSEGREDVMSIYLRDPADKNTFDLWVWRAGRTNPVSHADDMFAVIRKMNSAGQNQPQMDVFFDSGTRAWTSFTPEDFISDITPRFLCSLPTGSSADVEASGEWVDGIWTVTFSRDKKSVSGDDLDFSNGMELYISPVRPNEWKWDFNSLPSVRIILSEAGK